VWDGRTFEVLHTLESRAVTPCTTLHTYQEPGQGQARVVTGADRLQVFNGESGALLQSIDAPRDEGADGGITGIHGLASPRDGSHLLVVLTAGSHLWVIAPEEGVVLRRLEGRATFAKLWGLSCFARFEPAWGEPGRALVVVSGAREDYGVWDVMSGEEVTPSPKGKRRAVAVHVFTDPGSGRQRIAVGGMGGMGPQVTQVFDAESGEVLYEFGGKESKHTPRCFAGYVTSGEYRLLVGHVSGHITGWDGARCLQDVFITARAVIHMRVFASSEGQARVLAANAYGHMVAYDFGEPLDEAVPSIMRAANKQG
jgi:hypothetical protein